MCALLPCLFAPTATSVCLALLEATASITTPSVLLEKDLISDQLSWPTLTYNLPWTDSHYPFLTFVHVICNNITYFYTLFVHFIYSLFRVKPVSWSTLLSALDSWCPDSLNPPSLTLRQMTACRVVFVLFSFLWLISWARRVIGKNILHIVRSLTSISRTLPVQTTKIISRHDQRHPSMDEVEHMDEIALCKPEHQAFTSKAMTVTCS